MNVDLFCGAGGASIAMQALGLEPVGFDYDEAACATHAAAGHATVRCDLSTFAWEPFAGQVDVMHGSPPCQPFSASGKGAGEADERDGMPWFLRAVEMVRPRLVTVENVKGLTFEKHLPYLGWFLEQLCRLGYKVDWKVLNSADYGVPQTRERLVIVARNDGRPIAWPTPTHTELEGLFTEKWVSMAEALGWGMTARPAVTVACGTGGGPDPSGVGGTGARRTLTQASEGENWQVRTGTNSMVHGRTYDDLEPYERSVDRPAPTVDGKAAGAWTLNTGQGYGVPGERDSAYARDIDSPSPTVSTFGRVWQWRLNTGCDWKEEGDRDEAQEIPLEQPAPTISGKSGGQWRLRPGFPGRKLAKRDIDEPAPTVLASPRHTADWTWERPSTAIQADARVFPAGGHIAHDGRDNDKMVGRSENTIKVELEELATLQGFPDGYPFQGNKTQRARQIGNAMPPALLEAVLRANLRHD